MEEKLSGEISANFDGKEKGIFGFIKRLNEGGSDTNALIEEAKEELSKEWRYDIRDSEPTAKSFVDSYELKVSSKKVEKEINFDDTESIVNQLQEHLDKVHESVTAARDKLTEICNGRRKSAGELETRVNGELEEVFKQEDARIQEVVKVVKERINSKDPEEVKALTRKARLTLLKNQRYALEDADLYEDCGLEVVKEVSLKHINFEERKPRSLIPSFTEKGELSLSFAFFDEDEAEVLKEVDSPFEVEMEVKVWEEG